MQSIIDSGNSAFVFFPHGLYFVQTAIPVPCFLQHGNDTLSVTTHKETNENRNEKKTKKKVNNKK